MRISDWSSDVCSSDFDFVAGAALDDLPQVVVDNGKKSILDGLGLALSGSVAKSGELVRRHLADLNLGTGPATVIGSSLKVAPRFAAFANGDRKSTRLNSSH